MDLVCRKPGSHRMAADGTLSVTTSTDVALRGERVGHRLDTHLNSTLALIEATAVL
jgi:hypothetical protein